MCDSRPQFAVSMLRPSRFAKAALTNFSNLLPTSQSIIFNRIPMRRPSNRVTEKDIRDWLTAEGFDGRGAKIDDLELHAIERPGWVQVFRFFAQIRQTDLPSNELDLEEAEVEVVEELPDYISRYGVVLDDERIRNVQNRTKIWIYEEAESRQKKLDELSVGKFVKKKEQDRQLAWFTVTAICFIIVLIVIASLFE